ncbi:MAG: hypothetical protein ACC628_08640 [Pirellulaceae bacterium]
MTDSHIVDVASGNRIETQRDGSTLRFLARDLPSMGYRTYVPANTTSTVEPTTDVSSQPLENRFFRLRLDRSRGVLVVKSRRSVWPDRAW